MRRRVEGTTALFLALALLAAVCAPVFADDYRARGPANPLDYSARLKTAQELRKSRDFAGALYHGAWLAWLAPRKIADEAEASFLRDRRCRDGADSASPSDPVAAALVAAVDARRRFGDVCADGAVAQQSEGLEKGFADLAGRAEAAQVQLGGSDPVVRMALAHLYLAWDDAICLQADSDRGKDRRQVLRKAAAAAEAAAAAVPEAPGAYRTAAIARTRLAALADDPVQWDSALTLATRANSLDPADRELWQLLWALNLRAGRWDEAKRWEAKCEQGK